MTRHHSFLLLSLSVLVASLVGCGGGDSGLDAGASTTTDARIDPSTDARDPSIDARDPSVDARDPSIDARDPSVDAYDSVGADADTHTDAGVDADGDGFQAGLDCNDADADVFPGAVEVCGDGTDQNCDADPDDGCTVDHCGVISTSEVWRSNRIHRVTCTIRVEGPSVPRLTIENGAEVRVVPAPLPSEIVIGESAPGELLVDGTLYPITFTSEASSPARGDWGGIRFMNGATSSRIEGALIEYGGTAIGGAISGNFGIGTPTLVEVIDTTVRESIGDGIYWFGGGRLLLRDVRLLDNAGDGLEMTDSRAELVEASPITSTGNGGWSAVVPASDVHAFTSLGSDLVGNGRDGIWMRSASALGFILSESATWVDPGVPYVMDYRLLIGDQPGQFDDVELVLEEGVELRFQNAGATLAPGTLTESVAGTSRGKPGRVIANGTAANPVRLVGDAEVPGAWGGVYVGFSDSGSSFTHTAIEYGGSNEHGAPGQGAVVLECVASPTVSFTDVGVTDSVSYGVWRGRDTCRPDLTTVTFARNALGDLGGIP